VQPLDRGVYTVNWRVVSAIDGHATSGAYAFGVGVVPTGVAATTGTTNAVSSRLEMVSRWAFLIGLVALMGAGVAGVARFAGSAGADLTLGAGGWLLSAVGLVLLAEAQRRNADASTSALLHTSVGHALVWRGVAVGAAGAALLVARRASGRRRRAAMGGAALAALVAMVVHVSAGHAATGPWPHSLSVALQSVHFAAAGIWVGGLAALLLGLRGAPSADKVAAVRRFSIVAATGFVAIAATGTARAIEELTSWRDLGSTGYGRAVLVKIVLLLTIGAIAARNRLHSVPEAGENLSPLRRLSSAELVLATGALGAAALLGSLAPPAAGRLVTPLGITASASDSRSRVEVRLEAASAQPGPNRFVVHVVDSESHQPVPTGHVTLRFTPLDDPGVAPTSLELARAPGFAYAGSGANMVFDGRWGVTALVQRPGGIVRVALELDTPTPAQFVSIERFPGRPTKYTVEVGNSGSIRIAPDPERAGPSKVYLNLYDVFGNVVRARRAVLTIAAGDGPARQQPVRAVGNRFVADAELAAGHNTIAAVATTTTGVRLRAVLEIDVPDG
jgi:copper transport protein